MKREMDSPPPLEQRKSGRAQRRERRAVSGEGDSSNRTHPDLEQPRRGPSAAIEEKIAAAIEERKRANKANASINGGDDKDLYDENNEILGRYEYLDHTVCS